MLHSRIFFFLQCISVTHDLRYFPSKDYGCGFISPPPKLAEQSEGEQYPTGHRQPAPGLAPDVIHKIRSTATPAQPTRATTVKH